MTKKQFQICMKDHAGFGNQRSDVVIDYLIIGGKADNPPSMLRLILFVKNDSCHFFGM